MKRIVIFSDGTWNSPEHGETTNVLMMAGGIKPVSNGVDQVVFYDWGVGTDRKKWAGGISGAGIDKNIKDCYLFLIHNYEPGDHLFFFGFSRGGYTVRSLAGFIRNCGLLKREHADKFPEAYRLYRKRSPSTKPSQPKSVKFRRAYAVADETPIEFVGVWDTVGSLGIPLPFWGTLGEIEFLFHDTEPSRIVRYARHAVSIDENRKDFQPTLWTQKPGLDLKQVWFAGVHADVGGGYRDCGLGHCANVWMMAEAESCGLVFEPHLKAAMMPDPAGKQHNERKGIYLARPPHIRTVIGPVHKSVQERWENNYDEYRRKSASIKRLLASVDGDWSKIEVV